jgi:hypothetical protein
LKNKVDFVLLFVNETNQKVSDLLCVSVDVVAVDVVVTTAVVFNHFHQA